jgi:hypothetical protein
MSEHALPTRDTDLVDSVWKQQSVWSQTANQLKARIDHLRTVMLALAVASAVLTTLSTQVGALNSQAGKALVLAAGISVGLVPLVRARLGRDAVSRWTRARAVAEELKSELYPFLAGVSPFRGPDRAAVLADRTQRVQTEAADLLPHTAGVHVLPRQAPAVCDVSSYVQARLVPQIQWYRERAHGLTHSLARARTSEVTLSVIGVVLAAMAATWEASAAAAWVAVVTTMTAAVSSHVAASRWEYQLVEYLRTAAELDRLHDWWLAEPSPDEETADRLVDRCEQVVSTQNDGWMAKWTAQQS